MTNISNYPDETTLAEIIKILTQHEVIPIDENKEDDKNLLDDLESIADEAMKLMDKDPIIRNRPNEVGNDVEDYVERAISQNNNLELESYWGLDSGYPDILFIDRNKRKNYLEIKTYADTSEDSGFRSFYLSPGVVEKIKHDGHHILMAFCVQDEKIETELGLELRHNFVDKYKEGRWTKKWDAWKNINRYDPQSWRVKDCHNIPLTLKLEYNTNNKEMYGNPNDLRKSS